MSVKITLSSHSDVMAQNGTRLYVVGPGSGRVYYTACVNGDVSYVCLTDEDPANAPLPASMPQNATAVGAIEII